MRPLLTLIVIALLVAIAVIIADQPGQVAIQWQNWRIDTSVPVLIAATLLFALLAMLVFGIARRIISGPGAFLRARRERRRGAGYRALTQGMVAVAAGDAEEAQRQARKADVLLAEPPLTLLLSAQAAQLNGDEDAARRYFSEMLNRPETEFLGLRGLLTQALRAGDDAAALHLAERAHALRPKTPWVLSSLLELQVRSGAWNAAQGTLTEASKRKLVTGEPARHQQAVLLYERSRAAEAAGHDAEALALAAKAQDVAPEFAPAAVQRAQLLHRAGRDRAAAKAIEAAWRYRPHPSLSEAYGALFSGDTLLARVKRFEKLAAANPDHAESHIAIAQAALAAQLWGEARRHLEAAGARLALASKGSTAGDAMAAGAASSPPLPSARLCRLMAELDERERGDDAMARNWLARAAEAPPDPVYVCASCQAESLTWQPLCPRCRGFATLEWRAPARAVVMLDQSPHHPAALPLSTELARRAAADDLRASAAPPTPVDASGE